MGDWKMNLIAFFIDSGIPKEGLSPTMRVLKLDGTIIINDESMSEIGSGFYNYDFTSYDEDIDYVIRADGSNVLTGSDRYVFSSNETAGVGKILQIEKGNWSIVGTQMIFYDTDGTTALYTFDLTNKSGTPTDKDVFNRTAT